MRQAQNHILKIMAEQYLRYEKVQFLEMFFVSELNRFFVAYKNSELIQN